MPTVPAAGYPTGPEAPPKIDLSPGDAYLRIGNATPEAFGAGVGAALTRAGLVAEHAADKFADAAIRQQNFLNLTEEDKLSAQLDDELHKQKYGDPTAGVDANGNPVVPGFKNRYGSDAIDYIKSGAPNKDFNDTVTRLADSATNPRVREMFMRQSRSRRASFDTSLDEHWTTQLLEHNRQVQAVKGASAGRDIATAAGAGDELAIIDGINKLAESYVNASSDHDPVVLEGLRQKAHADGAIQAVDAALAAGNADRAKRVFETFRGSMTGEQQNRVTQAIEAAGERQRNKDEKQMGEDYERWLNGEGPRPRAPGARGGGAAPGGGGDAAPRDTGKSGTEAELHNWGGIRRLGVPAAGPKAGGFQSFESDEEGVRAISRQLDRYASGATTGKPLTTIREIVSTWAPPSENDTPKLIANAAKVVGVDPDTPLDLSNPDIKAKMVEATVRNEQGGQLPIPGGQELIRRAVTRPSGAGTGQGVVQVIANPPAGGPDSIERALKLVGHTENSADLAEYLHDGGVNMSPKDAAWCAGFVNATLAQQGMQGTGSLVATSFLKWGNPVANTDDVKRDDVVVLAKGLSAGAVGGHVGFATGNTRVDPATGQSQIEVLSGNVRVDPNDPAAGHQVSVGWENADAVTLRRAPGAAAAYREGVQAAARQTDVETGGAVTAEAPAEPTAAQPPAAAAAAASGAPPDWAAQAERIRTSDLPPGAKTTAFHKLEERKRMFEFAKEKPTAQYNAQVHAAVEQRADEIVQGAAHSDDPQVRAKAEQDLTTLMKWGVDSGAIPANEAYKAERAFKAQLITGRAQYLDATGKSDEALAFIQQNKDALPAAVLQQQIRSLSERAEKQQGERFERDLQIGGGPGYVPSPTPGMLPGGPADFPTPMVQSPLQQRLQAIANSDLPEDAKKAAHNAAISRHQLQVVGQEQTKSDLEMAIRRGEAGRPEIEQAYREDRISPAARTEMHTQLDRIDAQRNADALALQKVNNAGNGGAPLDPKSPEDKKALNFHYETVSKTWPPNEVTARSLDYAEKYGLVPSGFQGLIRGSLHSGSPTSMVAAAGVINQIRNRKPQLVGEFGDENDLRLATLIQTYTNAGVRPEQAVELATSGMKVSKTEQDARGEAFDEERGNDKTKQHDSDSAWLRGQLNSFWRADPDIDPVMRKEFEELSKVEYQRTGNLEAARTRALDNINNLWKRTRVGGDLRYMKGAPETYYGVPGLSDSENAAWMTEQLTSEISRDALQEPGRPITAQRLHLQPAPDRTAPDGRPAYQVWLEHPVTKHWEQDIRPDGQPRLWVPDWTSSAEKQRRDTAHQMEVEQGRLRLGAGRLPGFLGTGAYSQPGIFVSPP